MRALLQACQHGGEVDVHLVQQEGASEVAEGVEEILQLHLLEEMGGDPDGAPGWGAPLT